ncbi:MAG: ABC transporter substrate-binding protein [Candidatus Eisenbacteria bacterium]|uniref:ABC transporter substrate-binding protein n=1 Tax=Eiseniibacteriota bacterium TaxID=2212470 RepID=A0A956SFX2_UNCEI|nr:ABC transporter substrate-binding protein [Candidatus Eisenbacteria bacterium]
MRFPPLALPPRLVLLLVLAVLPLTAASCVRERPPAPEGVLVVSQEQQSSWIRNFNPLTTAAAPRWPTISGIYEPLFVFNSVKSEYVPWLGLDWVWAADARSVQVNTRPGVLWSDGQEFSAQDVEFTFRLLQQHPALDRGGVWGFLEDVRATDENTVEFSFQRVFIPGFDDITAQPIVPQHVWREVEDPVAFANETPVATGPFTEVRVFQNQVYELGKNPHYWQPGKPYIDGLRFPAYPSNDRANLALVFGEAEWAGNFVPAIDRVFVDRDPEDHGYWFPLTGSCIFLYANTRRAPFDDRRVRQALSLAIDRELLVEVALYRYSRPADATGLSDGFESWRDPSIGEEWVQFDPDEANRLLDEAGYERDVDGWRLLPDGTVWDYQIITVSGWSDWVRACQVIARGFEALGIRAGVRTYDFGAWFQAVQEGEFDLSLGWSFEGATPYAFYRWLMSSATVKPEGEPSVGNWHRFGSAEADSVLARFERETDREEQIALARELQRTFVREAPAIPLYPNPSWAEYNTNRIVGFPSRENPYADPSPNKFGRGETLLVLTEVRPR